MLFALPGSSVALEGSGSDTFHGLVGAYGSQLPGGQLPSPYGPLPKRSPAVTTVVGAEASRVEPPALLAVTTARIMWPTSALVSVSLSALAPLIAAQLSPAPSQSCH